MQRVPVYYVWIPILSSTVVLALLGFVLFRGPRVVAPRPMDGEQLLSQVVALVEERYIREVDEMEIAYDAIRGMVEGLDPYSQFYDPREKGDFQEETEGKFGGIGVSVIPRDGYLTVNYPILGSPADRAGVLPCERFVGVAGEEFGLVRTRRDQDAIIDRLKGRPGTEVVVTVEAEDGERREVTLVRESIPRHSVLGVEVLDPDARIGYLMIQGFQENTIAEFDEAVRKLMRGPGIRSLIVDLRFNPGGILNAAVELADRFLPSGIIVSTRGRRAQASRDYRAGAANTLPEDLGLVVLINGEAASASEVFAGAIQDHRRGVLVGEPTYGKGVVQNVLYLNGEEVVLKVTSAAYFTPSGRCIEKRVDVPGVGVNDGGISPDVLVRRAPRLEGRPSFERYLIRERPGENYREGVIPCRPFDTEGYRDPQLDTAISTLRGEPVFQQILGNPAGEGGE